MLGVLENQALNQHQTHEGLAQTNAIAEERAAVLAHPLRSVPAWLYRFVRFAAAAPAFANLDGQTVTVFAADLPEPPPDEPALPGEQEVAPPPVPRLDPVFTLEPPEKWPAGEPWLPPVALTPDGRGLLVRRPRNRVQLWDVGTGTLRNEWGWRLEAVACLAVAPDGLTAAVGGRFGRVLVWDLE